MMHTNTLYDVFIFFKISFHTFFEVKKVNIINKRNKNNKVFCEIEKKRLQNSITVFFTKNPAILSASGPSCGVLLYRPEVYFVRVQRDVML